MASQALAPLAARGELSALQAARAAEIAANKIKRARYLLWLAAGGDPEESARRKLADALECSASFLHWCELWGWVQDPDAAPELRDVPFVLWDSQRDLHAWLDERTALGETALMVKSRELGVTWLVLHELYWRWRFRGESSLLGSRTEELVDKRGVPGSLFEKLRYIHRRQPPHLRERRVQEMHMLLKNLRSGAALTGQATSLDFARGDRTKVVALDEFGAVPPRIAEATIRSIQSVGGSTWIVTNACGKAHKVYELYSKLAERMVKVMTWQAHPHRPSNFRELETFPNGAMSDADFDREYECVFGAVQTGLIWSFRRDVLCYDEDTAAWARTAQLARASWFAPGGWDFGSGASLLCCLFGLVEWSADRRSFHLWVDDELTWSQTAWTQAAEDVKAKLAGYGGPRLHYGDPAGRQRESGQQSWETNLQSGGVPLFCLPAPVNASEITEYEIKEVQRLINSGQLHVHARCAGLLEAMGGWRRNIPDYIGSVDMVSRAYVAPRHDAFSHACKALLYLVAGVKLQQQHELRQVGRGRATVEEEFSGPGSTASWRKLLTADE